MAVLRKEADFPREVERDPVDVTQEQIEALVKTAMRIVGARFLLVIGLLGGIGLTYLAMQSASVNALWAQSIFSLTVFAPLVWLSSKRAV